MTVSPVNAEGSDGTATAAVPVLRSRLLGNAGFRHGFSTRIGGVSDGPFSSLNLGVAAAPGEPDLPERILENRRRFGVAVAGKDLSWVLSRQVHGATVHWSDGDVADPRDLDALPIADAIASELPGRLLSVRTADCLPILVGCPRSGIAAAVHAGWRGLAGGTIPTAIETMIRHGACRDGLLAAVGPAISVERYEVGEEVIEAFIDAGVEPVHLAATESRLRAHLDLAATARSILDATGISPNRVDRVPACTFGESERFFSYRRDGARSGRLAAVIEPRR